MLAKLAASRCIPCLLAFLTVSRCASESPCVLPTTGTNLIPSLKFRDAAYITLAHISGARSAGEGVQQRSSQEGLTIDSARRGKGCLASRPQPWFLFVYMYVKGQRMKASISIFLERVTMQI